MKKVAKYTGIGLLTLILLAFLVPLLFKGKIVRLVKAEINKNVNAQVDFSDVSLSLFRHFPKLTVRLEGVSIVGREPFVKDTLVSAPSIDASVNLMSLFGGKEMNIYGIYLNEPRIHALVNKEGKVNWDIALPDTAASTGETTAFSMKLNKYAVKDGYVYYEDEVSGMKAEITGLNHEGKGNFTQDLFTLSTETNAEAASFTYGGIPYLVGAKTGMDVDVEVDQKSSRYSFSKADISVNDLKLLLNGFLRIDNDSTYSMDLKFDAPSNNFKDFLSLVPAVYKTDFEKLKTGGTAAFKGFVKGTYGPGRLPAYEADLHIKDGFFQYPDLPQPVKNIQLAMQVANPDGVMDHTVIDISRAHLEMGGEPVDFRLLFKNPETSRYLDAVVKGRLNLAEIGKYVKLEEGTRLAGTLWADAFAKGNLSALEQQKGPFTAGGFFEIKDLYYAAKALPQPVSNGNFRVQVRNEGGIADATSIDVTSGHLELGKDPFDFSLQLQHPVTSVDFNGKAKGRFNLENVKQFTTLEPGTSVKGMMEADVTFRGSKADVDRKDWEKIQTTGLVQVSNINYVSKEYPDGVQVGSAQLRFSPRQASLSGLTARFRQTNFTASGVLNNLVAYALGKEPLTGTMELTADKINLNKWMVMDTAQTSGSTASSPVAVPKDLDLTLKASAGEVMYDKVAYNNVRGTLVVKDEAVRLQNVQTEALDGTVAFNGSYATKENKKQPSISLDYDIRNVDVQKAFMAYNTVQKLMPLGKFLSGKISSQFSMTGKLDGAMMPDMSSLTGTGNLFLLQGFLSKFHPLDKLANSLNVNELRDVSLKDVKTYFEFTNGRVLVKPFALKVKDIDLQVGGTHGLDQNMDYLIGMKVPRRYMGAAGNNLVNSLASQAASKGIPVTLSDVIDLNIRMGGTLANPTIKTDLRQTAGDVGTALKQQAASFVQQKTDTAKQALKDSFHVVKNQVLADTRNSLINSITGNKDSASKPASLEDTKKKAGETIKNTLGGLFKKKQPADTTKKEGQ